MEGIKINPVIEFENEFKQYVESKYAIAVCNGTAALHTALSALEAKQGQKVITTAYTFPATVNSILMTNATPIFADIEPNSYNISPESIRQQIKENPETVGIIPVHLFGQPCNMKEIMELAEKHGLWVLEDASQAIGATYKGKRLGTIGDAGTYSFYATKNLSAYQGGMIVTDNPEIDHFSRLYRKHGILNGEMVIFGHNYEMPWNCAFHGLQNLQLHKPGIEAELGRYSPKDGYYPKVVYQHQYYQEQGITGDCPNAERLAEKVRSGQLVNS